jgi:hypothetical protein
VCRLSPEHYDSSCLSVYGPPVTSALTRGVNTADRSAASPGNTMYQFPLDVQQLVMAQADRVPKSRWDCQDPDPGRSHSITIPAGVTNATYHGEGLRLRELSTLHPEIKGRPWCPFPGLVFVTIMRCRKWRHLPRLDSEYVACLISN